MLGACLRSAGCCSRRFSRTTEGGRQPSRNHLVRACPAGPAQPSDARRLRCRHAAPPGGARATTHLLSAYGPPTPQLISRCVRHPVRGV